MIFSLQCAFSFFTAFSLAHLAVSAASTTASAALSAPTNLASIPASTLTQFTDFGPNPNDVGMFVYKPAKVATRPPLIVASHCAYASQAF